MKYILTLRVLPDTSDPNGIRRLRMALKTLLRAYRLRTEYIQVKPDEADGGQKGPDEKLFDKYPHTP